MLTGRMGSDLEGFLAAEKNKVHNSLFRFSEWIKKELPARVSRPICYSVMGEGKRLRPILCVMAYRVSGGRLSPDIYDLAASVELIHSYSLMHDDLPCMDDADLRRGRATPHRVYGEEDVLQAGAFLIPAASLWAARALKKFLSNGPLKRKIVRKLNTAAGACGMVGGQYLDLLSEGEILAPKQLENLHRMKTGALLKTSLTMGGMAANAEQELLDNLEEFGHWLGLAFQIKDDLLDATSSTEYLGKIPSDRIHSKNTYVSLYGVEGASMMAEEMKNKALDSLSRIDVDDKWLTLLTEYVLDRKK